MRAYILAFAIGLAMTLFTPVAHSANNADYVAGGRRLVTQVRNVYSSVNVTTSAWVQLVSSTTSSIGAMEIFDSSGATLQIGFGGSGSEITQFYVIPGGNGLVPVRIPPGTRVSIKAVSGTASTGEIDINFYE